MSRAGSHTGPPSGSDDSGDGKETIWDKIKNFFDSVLGGFIDLVFGAIVTVVGKLLDWLTSLVNMLTEKLGEVIDAVLSILDEVPRLCSGFLDFLSLIFPFIPPEITMLLTFGIIAVVFIAIIKALRGLFSW